MFTGNVGRLSGTGTFETDSRGWPSGSQGGLGGNVRRGGDGSRGGVGKAMGRKTSASYKKGEEKLGTPK